MRESDAIAVVGAACRLPGGLSSLDALWSALAEGRDLVTEVPPERFDKDRFYAADPRRPGKSYTFAGGFLDDVAAWDAEFFGCSPREASRMDPQQRLLLEMAVEAIDDAGENAASLAGSDTGVYVGFFERGYGILQTRDAVSIDLPTLCGTLGMGVANRVSYVFDLHGPSVAVDTACSSSLVAVHQACDSLRLRRSRLALAGGINVLLNPYEFILAAKGQTLSRRGRCQTFSAHADGYVRGEGGGLVLLKRLADAMADGDRVHGVILGSGTNCDGRTVGLANPSADAQEALLREVYSSAGVAPDEVSYFEAHGTGTPAGDPAECAAVGAALGSRRTAGALPVGSVKTNIGHLEAAAGVAGLLKAILVLRHGLIPPSLHAEELNSKIDFEGLGLEPVRHTMPLQAQERAIVGVNSFGIGGANAHVVVAAPDLSPPGRVPDGLLPIVVSGRSGAAVERAATEMADRLDAAAPEDFYDIAYTACRRRGHHPHRAAVLAASPVQGAERLRAGARAVPAGGRVGFVFSGNGSQWAGMGADLMRESKIFRDTVEGVDALLTPRLGWSVIDELVAPQECSGLARTEVAQPALFAVQLGLVEMLADWGIRPASVVGHSVGEVAAAWAAGALDLARATRVIAERSLAQGVTAGRGRMAAVGLSAAAAESEIAAYGDRLEVAGVNSESDVTISGDLADLEDLGERLATREVFFRMLDLNYAFHSRAMDAIEASLRLSLAGLTPSATRIEMLSTVTGGPAGGDELDAGYWWRNVREPVLFAPAVQQMTLSGCDVLVEIGPHPILSGYLRRLAPSAAVIATLSREGRSIEAAAAQVIATGASATWDRHFPRPGRVVDLPAYPWQRERHWNGAAEWWSRTIGDGRIDHPLLGERAAGLEAVWNSDIEPERLPWLADHKVSDSVVMPAAAYVEMAVAAGSRTLGGPVEITAMGDLRALVLPWDDPAMDVRTQVSLADNDGLLRIASRSGSKGSWQVHARARVRRLLREAPSALDVEAVRSRLGRVRWSGKDLYARVARAGLPYGPGFQVLRELCVGDREVLAEYGVDLPAAGFEVHPAFLDAAIQAALPLVAALDDGQPFLPAGIDAVRVWRRPDPHGRVHVRLRAASVSDAVVDVTLTDDHGNVALEVEGCRLRRFEVGRASLEHHVTVMRAAPRPGMCSGGSPLPGPRALVEAAGGRLADLDAIWRARRHGELAPRLVECQAHFAAQAFAEIIPSGATFTTADVIAAGALPKHRRLIDVLARMAHQAGLLEQVSPNGWRMRTTPAPQDRVQAMIADHPEVTATLLVFVRTGCRLAGLLRGERDPLELIFEEADAHLVELLYGTWPGSAVSAQRAAAVVARMVERWPADRPLRVLEVGAGTGTTTAHLLPLLPPERTRYAFTDVSAAFLHRAQTRFAAYDFIEYRTLDLNRDPGEQGFAHGSFELVLAANVLHATAELRRTLGRIGSLLAPGGDLLAVETHDTEVLSTVFGLLDSFWGFTDAPLRESTPLISPARWLEVLASCGFEDVALIGDGEEPVCDSVLLARHAVPAPVPADVPAAVPAAATGSWIIAAEPADAELAHALAARLDDVSASDVRAEVAVAEPDADWADLLGGREANVVLLLGGDPACPDGLTLTVRRAAQLRGIAAVCARLADATMPALWLVTRPSGALPAPETPDEPVDAAIWGTARTLANEHPALTIRSISLHRGPDIARVADRLVSELRDPGDEDEILVTAAGRFVPRVVPLPPATGSAPGSYALRLRGPGSSYRLAWSEVPLPEPGPDEVIVAVRAAALNYRDVLQALGTLDPQAADSGAYPTGFECAGVVASVGADVTTFEPGDHVFAMAHRAFASHVAAKAVLVGRMPAGTSFAEAATLPVAFFSVHHSLHHLARLTAGETMLVHGAAGGVGLAAVQYARHVGAHVIATVGTPAKRDLLHMLGVEHVLNSRDLTFAEEVKAITGGRGIDVVLNSLAGEAVPRGLELLRPGGRFIELGKRDLLADRSLSLRLFRDGLTFATIDADRMLRECRPEHVAQFAEVAVRVEEGIYRPLPHSIYPADRAEEAYRALQHSRHIGKLVISLDDPPPVVEGQVPEPSFDPAGTYLVTGGLSGLGATTARWLAEHGARHLALVSRRGGQAPHVAALLGQLGELGATATAHAVDVTDEPAMKTLIAGLQAGEHPLRGVIHAAMHLDDVPLSEGSDERFAAVLAPKMRGAQILDRLTGDSELDLFVAYSSVITLVGNRSQSAYVAGNLFVEALARRRRRTGRAGLAVGWGVIDDVGHVARQGLAASLTGLGFGPIDSTLATATLAGLLGRDVAVATAARADWERIAAMYPLASTPRFARLLPPERAAESDAELSVRALKEATPEEATRMIEDGLAELVARVLETRADRIQRTLGLDRLGVDSLLATELTVAIRNRFGCDIPLVEIVSAQVSDLARRILIRLRPVDTAA